jgi:hypothetical protein
MSVIPALGRSNKNDQFKAKLGYILRLHIKRKKNKTKKISMALSTIVTRTWERKIK